MKFTVDRTAFLAGLTLVLKAAGPRNAPLAVLENVLIHADSAGLILTCCNLEATLSHQVKADVTESGATTVRAALLKEIITAMQAPTLEAELAARTQTLIVTAGRDRANVKGIGAADFPKVEKPAGKAIVFQPSDDLALALRRVLIAAAGDESRPALMGVYINKREGEPLQLATADGFRLSVVSLPEANGIPDGAAWLIPAKWLALLTGFDLGGSLTMTTDVKRVAFDNGTTRLLIQLIDSPFPDYRAIVPKAATWGTNFVVETTRLTEALRQLNVFARDAAYLTHWRWLAKPGASALELTGKSSETGDARCELDLVSSAGDSLNIALNGQYVADALKVAGTAQVRFTFGSMASSPVKIEPVGDDNFLHLVMPMALPGYEKGRES